MAAVYPAPGLRFERFIQAIERLAARAEGMLAQHIGASEPAKRRRDHTVAFDASPKAATPQRITQA